MLRGRGELTYLASSTSSPALLTDYFANQTSSPRALRALPCSTNDILLPRTQSSENCLESNHEIRQRGTRSSEQPKDQSTALSDQRTQAVSKDGFPLSTNEREFRLLQEMTTESLTGVDSEGNTLQPDPIGTIMEDPVSQGGTERQFQRVVGMDQLRAAHILQALKRNTREPQLHYWSKIYAASKSLFNIAKAVPQAPLKAPELLPKPLGSVVNSNSGSPTSSNLVAGGNSLGSLSRESMSGQANVGFGPRNRLKHASFENSESTSLQSTLLETPSVTHIQRAKRKVRKPRNAYSEPMLEYWRKRNRKRKGGHWITESGGECKKGKES